MSEFNEFMRTISDTNATLEYFTDFQKVKDKIESIEIDLNQLNYLIGKEDLKKAIEDLYEKNPSVFKVLNVLIAVRDSNTKVIDIDRGIVLLRSYFQNPSEIYKYIEKTGIIDILRDRKIKNLVDYVFGIEVGLDTNARKNRGGKIMEKLVANVFEKNNINYIEQGSISDDIGLGVDKKVFDFIIKTNKKTYLIEVNYYNSGGSKLNEVARSYSELALKINETEKYEFVWITDGQGWQTAKTKLEEAFSKIDKIYNLKTIEKFIKGIKNGQF